MSSFDFSRFAAAFQSHFWGARKKMLWVFLGLALFFFLFQMFFIIVLAWGMIHQDVLETTMTYCATTFIFVITYGASCIVGPADQQRRADFQALPATGVEKFLVRYVHVTLLLSLVYMLAFVCADAIRVLAIYAIDGEVYWGLPVLFEEITKLNAHASDPMMIVFELGAFFFGHSVFVLGGTLFRRFPFLLTLLCFCAVIFVLALLPVFDTNTTGSKWADVIDYSMLAAFYLLAAFNYWLACKRFCRIIG